MNFNAPVVTMLYAAICGVLLIVLALNIVRLRRSHRVSLGLGEGAALEQPVRVHGNFTEYTPTYVLTLEQVSQAWCRRALAKPGNTALFPSGTTPASDAASAKATIQRWSVHFHAQPMSAADLFAPLLAETNATNAYVGLCSFFIRHPLWSFY